MSVRIPRGWEAHLLGSLIEFKYGKALPEKSRSGAGFPVFGSSGNVGAHMQSLTSNETIVIGRKGSVGVVHYSNVPCSPIDTTYYVDDVPGANFRYWFYQLKALRLQDLNKSTAIPGLSRSDVYALNLLIPPLNEQRRIANKLDTVLTRVDAVQDRLAHITPLLKRFRQSILAAATSGRLTNDWRSEDCSLIWIESTLGAAAINKNSLRVPISEMLRKGRKGVYPYYGASGVIDGIDGFTHDGEFLLIGEDGANLLSRSKPIAFRATGKIWVNNHAHVLSSDNSDKLDFLSFFVNSIDLKPWVTGSAQPKLTRKALDSIPIRVPPDEEQTEIVRRIELLMGYADRLEARLKAAQTAAERLTPALLAKAFRGELVPQDPNDEPASELLRRLREQRAAQAPAKPKRGPRKVAAQ